ncbi:sensor histidine kinase [Nocardioides lianchengensis]|uniref:histidine kinase n=1 Tax=Nocardioides lianchengensis TaxID=1045774 RepID=A0A1G6L088_9ACTN|nr:HAMP domain-containing sensor histidine kinase [Nocardioides lianchengensis]NYG13764.1 two-component system sensor histidine kinase MprB [Nocardioides lianchengensis]SDC36613.1 two-component system, OmpR family, sensor histidine kinase MprB [Nocardioides lianchengensis]
MTGTLDPDGRWHYRRSLASRVTLLTTMAVGVAVAFVAVGAYVVVRMQLQASMDDSLIERANATAGLPVFINANTGNEFPAWALTSTDVRIGTISADGRGFYPYKDGEVPKLGDAELEVAAGKSDLSVRTARAHDSDSRFRVVAVPYRDDEALVICESLESQEQLLTKLGVVMALFGAAGVIAAAMAGWGVAANGLRPVRLLTGRVEHIARTEELQPIPVEGHDEIARLSSAFNQMLASLAASRDRQRQLVADAGHELRTPLTSLRTNLDLLAQSDASGGAALPPEARAELLDDVRAQIEEMTTLIGDLVELARDEPMAHVIETVDLAEVVDHALSRVRRRGPGVRIDLDVDPWYVIGEQGALERAVTNLLDNAVKWSPAGGTVRVALTDGELTVEDEGPGIADADLPRVFERFWRSDESRSMPGSGLGLSIVQQVAVRHSGTVAAGRAASGGARMVLRIPGASTPPPAEPAASTEAEA